MCARVAILTSVHPWNDPRIFLKEARSLAAAGHDVSLIAPRDSDENIDGVQCIGLAKPRSRFDRMLVTPWKIFAIARGFDICHFHDPELIPVGIVLKLLGKSVVYDVHEDLPRAVDYKHWIPLPLRWTVSRLVAAVEFVTARLFDLIIAATPTIAARFPSAKTVLVQNFPLLDELVVPQSGPYSERPAHFAYVGGVAETRGATQMVDAMAVGVLPANARLIVAGPCSPESLLTRLQSRDGWRFVDYRGYQGRSEIGLLLGEVRAGLVVLQPTQNLIDAFPTKLFEYMSASLPVVSANHPVCRQIVEEGNLGLLVEPRDTNAIAGAMRWILDNPAEAEAMGKRGRELTLRRYNWDVEAGKLLAAYETLSSEIQRKIA